MIHTPAQTFADADRALANAGQPGRLVAGMVHSVLSSPWFAAIPTARAIGAWCELISHPPISHTRPDFRINTTEMRGRTVVVSEEVVWQHPFCNLVHFSKETTVVQPTVLLVAPLSGHFATLLRDTVKTLLPEHNVYITDWKNPSDVPISAGKFGIDESIGVIMECIRSLGPDTHVIAVCQPVVTVLAAVALLAAANDPNQPKSMTLMGGPIDTRINPTGVNELATSHPLQWFGQVISRVPFPDAGVGRSVYPGSLQLAAFLSMNMGRHVKAHRKMFDNHFNGDLKSAAKTRRFYDEYTAVMDLDAEFYLDTLERVFKEHHLPLGIFLYQGNPVVPGLIERTACLVIEGEFDDVCGIGQTRAALTLLTGLHTNRQHYHLQPGVGHYGLFNGAIWNDQIYPELEKFIKDNH